MNKQRVLIGVLVLVVPLLAAIVGLTYAQGPQPPRPLAPEDALGTAFTYQGQLRSGGEPVSDDCDMAFRLYDQAGGGSELSAVTHTVPISEGLFTVGLDFGSGVFAGDARWLGIRVSCPGDSGFTNLGRQALNAAPYAQYSLSAGALQGHPVSTTAPSPGQVLEWNGVTWVPATYDGAAYAAGTGLDLTDTTFSITPTYRLPQGCAGGQIAKWDGSGWQCGDDDKGAEGAFWSLTGNGGTNPGTNFLGTTDGVSLTLAVSGTTGLRLVPTAGTPNLVGGYGGNSVAPGVVGAVIGGGGQSGWPNEVTADFGMILGGDENTVSGSYGAIGGGGNNTVSGFGAVVGGGVLNDASGSYATVGGGWDNSADDNYATVPGGRDNTAQGAYSFAAGRRAQALHDGAFVWADSTDADFTSPITDSFVVRASGGVTLNVTGGGLRLLPNGTSLNLIGGYGGNWLTPGVYGATIGGGGASGWLNRVTDVYGTVAGGRNNQAGDNSGTTSDASYATVAGGISNVASNEYATVGGGNNNIASGGYATVGGGSSNDASGYYATSGGGSANSASDNHATVAGGQYNEASGDYNTVGGGFDNTANGYYGSTVSGGNQNTASGNYGSTVSGGNQNTASADAATVGGGDSNTASGYVSTVPGGEDNTAQGDYSFAAGRRAQANNDGCFVWGDSYDGDVACDNDNRWVARASGGVYFYTNSTLTSGVYLAASGSSWLVVSDQARKENLEPVDSQELLARLAEIEISTWNYLSQDPSIRHIGPTAQDFNALLPDLGGEGEEYINTLDADGVALAAIQGLYEQNQELQEQVNDLEARLATLEAGGAASSSTTSLLPWSATLLAGVGLAWALKKEHLLALIRREDR